MLSLSDIVNETGGGGKVGGKTGNEFCDLGEFMFGGEKALLTSTQHRWAEITYVPFRSQKSSK